MSEPGLRLARRAAYEGSRPELRAMVPSGSQRILDLGCSTGAVGAELMREPGVEVVGIELDESYASQAESRLSRVIQGDIEELAEDLGPELGEFDCLLAGDVLEHLRDPWRVLRTLAPLIRRGGAAVVSLPNVRYWETFWQLGVRGTWPVRSAGTFDRDHLRWFTVSDGLGLMRQAGLHPDALTRVYRMTPTAPARDRLPVLDKRPLRALFTFQFVLRGRAT